MGSVEFRYFTLEGLLQLSGGALKGERSFLNHKKYKIPYLLGCGGGQHFEVPWENVPPMPPLEFNTETTLIQIV